MTRLILEHLTIKEETPQNLTFILRLSNDLYVSQAESNINSELN